MRRALTILLVLVVLLVAGAVVADRVVHARAEDEVADRLGEYLEVQGARTVTIDGFPFLTQLAARELGSVRATADAIVVEGIELVDVSAHATGVGVTQPSTVEHLEIVGSLDQATVQTLVEERAPGAEVTLGPDGVRLSTEVLGTELAILAEPVVESGALTIAVRSLSLGGAEIDPGALAGFVDEELLSLDIDLDLPLGLQMVDAATRDGSIDLTLEGRDVVLEE